MIKDRSRLAVLRAVGLITCWAVPLPVMSATETDAATSSLQEIVVTATKSDRTIGDLPNNVSVISRAEIEGSAAHTVDALLRQIPGFNMLRQQDSLAAAPTTQGASLRGIGGTAASRSLVLLDGIPIHDAFSAQVYWSRVPKQQIERIEVVRGGGATVWGNRTVGGVINIITRKPRAGGLNVDAALGNSDTVDLSASATHIIDDWAFSANGNYYDTDGYPNIPANQRNPINVNVAKETYNVGGKISHSWSKQLQTYFSGNWLDEERQDDTPKNVNVAEIGSIGTGAVFTTSGGDRWQVNLFADFADLADASARAINDGADDVLIGNEEQDSVSVGANLVWARRIGTRHELSAGIDYLWVDADIDQFLSYVDGIPSRLKQIEGEQQLFGFFVQDIYSPGGAWEFIFAGRFDHVENDGASVDTAFPTGAFLTSEDFSRNSETTFNPSVGLRYRIDDAWSLRGSAYGGFRAPTIRELYRSSIIGGRDINLTANPNLGPEELKGIEGGVDYAPSASLLVRTTVFHNIVEDVIQNVTIAAAGATPEVIQPCGLVDAGFTCQQLQNVGELEATGLELEVEYRPHIDWRLFASYALQDVEIAEAPTNPQLVGNQVRQSTENQFTAKIDYSNARFFDATLQGRYVGERFEDDLNQLEVDDFFLVDLVLSRSLSDSLSVFLSAENLFDEEYDVSINSRGEREIGRDRFVSFGFRYRR